MEYTLIAGIILLVGFVFGEIARRLMLPKVTGYIFAGILLKLHPFHTIPSDFLEHTAFITNISLAFITFSVGGTLLYSRFKRLGRAVACISLCEACLAVAFVICAFIGIAVFLGHLTPASWAGMAIPLSILLGTFASPTDPATTLAVTHEYRAHGDVSSSILGIAAFDDAFGIIIFSVGTAMAQLVVMQTGLDFYSMGVKPLIAIGGGVGIGIVFALAFNQVTSYIRRATKGTYIVLILGTITLCFSVAHLLECDELLATMAMGCIVANFNPNQNEFFEMIEHYIEELIFVLFFTLSGMYFEFSALSDAFLYIVVFVLFRSAGKVVGASLGASWAGAPDNVRKYTGLGLIPQGGIVIGLALMVKANPAFSEISDSIVNIVIGATVIHELVGPITVKAGLRMAGEILTSQKESAYVEETFSDWESPAATGDFFFVDVLQFHKVEELLPQVRKVETVPEDIKFSQFKKMFLSTKQDYFPVVDHKNRLTGIFSTRDFRSVLLEPDIDDLIVVKDLATTRIISTTPEETLSEVMYKFSQKNLDSLPVVDARDGQTFIGMLRRKEVIAFYNRKVRELSASQPSAATGEAGG
jgi:Kef-type K+ transport system membrane component KefB/CBS domain-containing protein